MNTPYDQMIKDVAQSSGIVSPTLLQALVCQESGGEAWATRFENSYWNNSVVDRQAKEFATAHRGIPTYLTEKVMRSTSFGLTQIMGQVARENGWRNPFLVELCEPTENLNLACRLLAARYKKFGGDEDWVILSWNRGPGCKRPTGGEDYLLSVKRFMRDTPYRSGGAHGV